MRGADAGPAAARGRRHRAGLVVLLGGLPLLFLVPPPGTTDGPGSVPLPVAGRSASPSTPWSWLLARCYVRHAERIERDFTDFVDATA